MKRTHNCGELRKEDKNNEVILTGWVQSIRHHGKVAFINLKDRYGVTQVVLRDENLIKIAKEIGLGWLLSIKGKVFLRPENAINPNLKTGEIEVFAEDIEIISKSNVLPFALSDEQVPKEELRLQYRYLDLRRDEMQKIFIFKSYLYYAIRKYLIEREFVEIETPILGKSSPEGAREFLVPSRLQHGKFYSLVQSPQIYKQLLMVAGFDKYFQFARCFRDEDLRSDRQFEFTQLDIEQSFVDEEDIFSLIEGLMKYVIKELLNIEVKTPFKRITYDEAIRKYGSDKPDLRLDYEIKDITEIAKKTDFKIFKNANRVYCLICNEILSNKEIEEYEGMAKDCGIGLSWLKYEKGNLKGLIGKYFNENLIKDIVTNDISTIFIVAGDKNELLGRIRNAIIKKRANNGFEFVWITDFPMFEHDEITGKLKSTHHPFVMPKNLDNITWSEPDKIIGRIYDLVINGVELGTGSIRIHNRELQEKVMEILGIDKKTRERDFGCLLKALEYGAPPHGGIAIGLDRLTAVLLGKDSIHEVIAFPKTTKGIGLLENIPAEVNEKLLKELHIKIEE